MGKIYQRCWAALKSYRKLFCAEKIPTVDLSLLQLLEETQKREMLYRSRIIDEKHQRDLKSEYYKGHWHAQAAIFAAMRKEPDKYLAFIEKHRVEKGDP